MTPANDSSRPKRWRVVVRDTRRPNVHHAVFIDDDNEQQILVRWLDQCQGDLASRHPFVKLETGDGAPAWGLQTLRVMAEWLEPKTRSGGLADLRTAVLAALGR